MSSLAKLAVRIRAAPSPGTARGHGKLRFVVAPEQGAHVAASHPDVVRLLLELWNMRYEIAEKIEGKDPR